MYPVTVVVVARPNIHCVWLQESTPVERRLCVYVCVCVCVESKNHKITCRNGFGTAHRVVQGCSQL